MSGTCGTYGELRGSVSVPEGKSPLGSLKCNWENIFKMENSSKKLGVCTDLAKSSMEWREFLDERTCRFYQLLNTLLHTLCL
jgi:hypothetical protein